MILQVELASVIEAHVPLVEVTPYEQRCAVSSAAWQKAKMTGMQFLVV